MFAVFGVMAALLNRVFDPDQPGEDPPDQALGAVVGGIRGSMLGVVMIAILAAAPTTSAVGQAAQRSRLVDVVADPEGFAMTIFEAATGEDGILALIEFNRSFPDGPVVSDDFRQIPAFDVSETERLTEEGIEILELVNHERTRVGLHELTWSSGLKTISVEYAEEMYAGGFFAHVSARTGDVGTRLRTAGVAYSIAGENLALAPDVEAVHEGLMNSPGHRANILAPDYTHIGIGVVEGPIGLMVVQVFLRP